MIFFYYFPVFHSRATYHIQRKKGAEDIPGKALKISHSSSSECSWFWSHTGNEGFGWVAPLLPLGCSAHTVVCLLVCWWIQAWDLFSVISFTYERKIGDEIIPLCDKPEFKGQCNKKKKKRKKTTWQQYWNIGRYFCNTATKQAAQMKVWIHFFCKSHWFVTSKTQLTKWKNSDAMPWIHPVGSITNFSSVLPFIGKRTN